MPIPKQPIIFARNVPKGNWVEFDCKVIKEIPYRKTVPNPPPTSNSNIFFILQNLSSLHINATNIRFAFNSMFSKSRFHVIGNGTSNLIIFAQGKNCWSASRYPEPSAPDSRADRLTFRKPVICLPRTGSIASSFNAFRMRSKLK